jgi:hypothetical protein
MPHCCKPVPALFLCVLLSVLSCGKYPAAPNYIHTGDCGRPTVPPGLVFNDSAALHKNADDTITFDISPPRTDSNFTYGYLEIYDYEKNLILTLLSIPIKGSWQDTTSVPFNAYWTGTDSKGNKVDNGRYTFKVSFISRTDTSCRCGDIFLTTN